VRKFLFLLLGLLSQSTLAQLIPADGLWTTVDDPANGSGLMLATQNGITVVSVFTYDEVGQNIWYTAAGRVDESGVLEVELRQSRNGDNILNGIPQTAEFVETTRNLSLMFTGSQVGRMSIDDSVSKAIRTQHFGYAVKTITFESNSAQDERQLVLPNLAGDWLLGDAESGASYILDLEAVEVIQPPGLPQTQIRYTSVHPSTNDWELTCSYARREIEGCSVARLNQNNQPPMVIKYDDLGNQNMTVFTDTVPVTEKYQAFRLNKDRRLLPNDGLWRPSDDPAIGSGLAMRTQGDYTVVLLYSYDESGQPKWQIASGQFDENGLFSAALLTPEGGTAIEDQSPVSAEFSDQVQNLEIQLQGLELATFSIDGSEPKYIQNYNFGVELFKTKIFQPMNQPYVFPSQFGQWVLVDSENSVSSLWNLYQDYPNGCQSPPNPIYFDSVVLSNGPSCSPQPEPIFDNQIFRVLINCINSFVPVTNVEYPDFDFCYGDNYASDGEFQNLKINFSDIGFNQFRFYTGPDDPESYFDPFFEINHNSPMFQLFRLSN
jgi:hypothetical protein